MGACHEGVQRCGASAAGNVYATGYFDAAVDFGSGLVNSAGGDDAFVVKFDSSLDYQWSHTYGAGSDEQGGELALVPDGMVVTGWHSGAIDFGLGALNPQQQNAFVAKLAQ